MTEIPERRDSESKPDSQKAHEQVAVEKENEEKKQDVQNQEENDINEDDSLFTDVIPPEVLAELPREARNQIRTSLSISGMMRSSRVDSPLAKKLTPEHIGTIIDNQEKESKREFDLAKTTENTKRFIISSILGLVVIVLTYAGITQDKQLSEKVMIAAISAIGGGGAGYAVGKSKNK